MTTRRALSPFGIEVTNDVAGRCITSLGADELRTAVADHRVVVLRGFSVPEDEQTVVFCGQLGEILQWEFGAINELRVDADAQNYLYTNRAVPFHWDGAFVGRVPHVIFFHCAQAPPDGHGGETLFCNTVDLVETLTREEREHLHSVTITYSTDKIAHYGGQFTAPLLSTHPVTPHSVMRFAEPVDDLNPVHLEITGVEPKEREAFLVRMGLLLRDHRFCLVHGWQTGDVVLADNHALLHGRQAFKSAAPRHLRRINIL